MGLIASKDVVNEADESVVTIELDNTTPIVGIEIRPVVNLKALHACVFRWERLPSASATPKPESQGVFPFNAQNVKTGEITLLASSISYIPTQYDVGHKLRFSCTLLSSVIGITKFMVTDICIPLPMNPPSRKWAYYDVRSNVVPLAPSTPTVEHMTATSIGGISASVSSAITSPSFVSLSPIPGHLQMLQHNISNVSTYIQTNFVVLTYNMMLVGEQPSKRLRKQYATCPSYALSFVYRKKLLLRELLSHRADIMCLQQVESLGREYWDVELSKEGYSGFSDFDFEKTNHSVLLYKRAKFSKVKDWQVRFLDEFSLCFDALKSPSFADPIFKYFQTFHLPGDKCDQARSLLAKQIALVSLLELKDVAMMREEAEHGKYDAFGKVLVINVHSQKLSAMIPPPGTTLRLDDKILAEKVQLLQVYLLVRKITFILDEVGVKVPIIIAGSFDSTCSSLFYKMLSNGRISLEPNIFNSYASSLVKHSSAVELSPPSTTSENHADEISTETENDEKQLLATHRTTEVRQAGSEIKLPFAMKSAYKQVQGHEPTFFLSTSDNAKAQVEDFIWYTSSDLEAKRVCKIPQTQSFPNVDFVSNHVALLAELDLVQLNAKEDEEVGYSSGEDQEADSMEGLEMN